MVDLLTVAEFAKKVGKSTGALYADIARGVWPHIKIGRRIYFRADTLERYIAAHERGPK